jgi:hypothetical protein
MLSHVAVHGDKWAIHRTWVIHSFTPYTSEPYRVQSNEMIHSKSINKLKLKWYAVCVAIHGRYCAQVSHNSQINKIKTNNMH